MQEKDQGQLSLGLDTTITAEEVLRKFDLKGYSLEFARRINSVAGDLPDETPIYQLLLWNQKLLKRAERRITYRRLEQLRSAKERISPEMLEGYSDEEKERRVAIAKVRIEELQKPVILEPAPDSWTKFVGDLLDAQKTLLFSAIGRFFNTEPIHYIQIDFERIRERSAYVHTVGDLREKVSRFDGFEPGPGFFPRQVKKAGGVTNFFIETAFRRSQSPS